MKFELPRGMRDLDAEEFNNINYVREKFLETAALFNFKVMEPSPLELLATLEAKSGAGISNEIYSFSDKADRSVALRFDLTVGLTRYVAARRDLKMPAKIASFAGVWRYDEPQAGRYRYFHQWDVEIYGPFSQESDAEVIEFVSSFFKRLNLDVVIKVNDRLLLEEYVKKKLGISSQPEMLEMFRAADKVPKKGEQAVMQEYKDKIDQSKLRALVDLSKIKGSAEEVAAKADVKGLEGWKKLADLMNSLKHRKVDNAIVNLGIVRGLDYYSGIVFEAFDPSSDSGALVGGGRYDKLTDAFGRNDIGATGVAGGVERIILALQKHGILKVNSRSLVYVAYASDQVRGRALAIVSKLRGSGITTDYDISGKTLRKQLEDSANKGAALTVIVAPAEIAAGQIIVRSMKDGKETKHPENDLVQVLQNLV